MDQETLLIQYHSKKKATETRKTLFISLYQRWTGLAHNEEATFKDREQAWSNYILARDLYLRCPNPNEPIFEA